MNAENTLLEKKIFNEQVRLIYKQGPILAVGAGCAAITTALLLWQAFPYQALLYWLMAVFAASLFRVFIFRAYWRSVEREVYTAKWGRYFAWGSFFAGVVWGIWPVLFYSAYPPEYLLLISTIFAGMIAVLATSGSMYIPAFYAFAIPLVLPLALYHILSGVNFLVWTGWLLVMFFFVNLALAMRGNKHSHELIAARFKNNELMAQLSEEKSVAESAVVAKNRFIAAASHDLRQPLHAMSLFTTALGNTPTNNRQTSIISDLEKSVAALKRLFDSLLDVSRLEANTMDVVNVTFPIQGLLDAMHTEFYADAESRNLCLRFEPSDLVVHTDRILLERILRNLLSNALRYTQQGEVTIETGLVGEGLVEIKIIDTGVGIAADEIDTIFSEYHQLNHSRADQQGGMGLGLSIVKGLCKLLELDLQVVSKPGQGSQFRVILPLGDSHELESGDGQVSNGVSSNEDGQQVPDLVNAGALVLLIDDDQSILTATRVMLEAWGCRVLCAASPSDALKSLALSDAVPDVILSDYRLGNNQSGIELVHCVREWVDQEIPALIITGDTSPERLKEVSASGLPIMHKPLLAAELQEVVSRLLRDKPGQSGQPARERLAYATPS